MNRPRARQVWLTLFVVIAFLPAVLRAISPERQLLGPELTTITGLLATALLVCTVVLPSRLRSLTRAFGIEAVLRNHRTLGLATALSVLAHVAAVFANDPRGVGLVLPFINQRAPADTIAPIPLLNPLLSPPARSLWGVLAALALVLLATLSARRDGRYETWRAWHLLGTAAVLLGTLLHIVLIGHLIPTHALLGLLLGDPLGWTNLKAATGDPLAAGFLGLLALAVLVVAIGRWFMRPNAFTVMGVRRESTSVSSITLRPVRRGLRFRPGQFAWLRLTKNPLRSEEHPFTVCTAEQDRPTIGFTIKHVGDWTKRLRSLGPGDTVYVDGPYGSFTINERSKRGIVLIAAGVGITPMMSILRTAARKPARIRRATRLILLDRPGQGLFREELALLGKAINLIVTELEGERLTIERMEGALPPAFLHNQLEYYICGSPSLVRDAVTILDAMEIPLRRIHTEQFNT